MFGRYEGKDLGELADEVVDLEVVVVGMGLVLLGGWCRLLGRWFGGRTPLSLGRGGGVVCWMQRRRAHMVHCR